MADPIWSEDNICTDHLTVHASFRMPKVPSYSIEEYSYRHLCEESHVHFGMWVRGVSWQPVLDATDVNTAVSYLHSIFENGLNEAYEIKYRKKKSSEPTWMPEWLRNDIQARRQVFNTDQGRSDRWRILKKRTAKLIKKRQKKNNEMIIAKFDAESNPGKFFEHLKSLAGKNVSRWSPQQMFPGQSAESVADTLAEYFNAISCQYDPLNTDDTPVTFDRQLPTLTPKDVAEKIKKSKKPTSTVPGDIPALLFGRFHDELSVPVSHVFNLITSSKQWPKAWKTEYITVIPKCTDPQSPSECRNIACTNYLSKLYETILLAWSREEVRPKLNQYGGEPQASAAHLLIEVMSDLTTALEDNRAGIVVSALDFSKAFNRLDHLKCLQSFVKKGSSTQILQLLAAFLTGRSMTVRLDGVSSKLRPVNAGAPQGSVLGCYLFNVGVDDLEEDFNEEEADGQRDAHDETHVRTDDFPASFTPKRVNRGCSLTDSPIAPRNDNFVILPRVANVPHWIRKPKDPEFHYDSIKTYKYVDDEVNTNKVNMKKSRMLVEDGRFFKEVIDTRTQELLQHIARKAESKGMAINASKTGLMLVSAASSFEPRVWIELDGQTVTGQDHMKLLGVTIDRDASFGTHIERIATKMRPKLGPSQN